MKTISVIIPVYNAEEYIERTVEGINKSTIIPYEIILVNDGSTDNSITICRELKKRYTNIELFDKQNGGVADARNYGLSKASGDYVCFVDQDDYVDLLMYEKALIEIDARNSDVVMVSTGQVVNGNKIPYEQLKNGFFREREVREQLLLSFLFRGYEEVKRTSECSISSSIWKCVIKKSLLTDNKLQFKRFINYEDDYIMMTGILCNANSISTLDYIGYYWVINNKSESHRPNYISDYGKKVFQLRDYMILLLNEAGVEKKVIDVFSSQLMFERTIDVIANANSNINSDNRGQRMADIEYYLKESDLFNIDLQNIRPLRNYHRLNVLYSNIKKQDANKLSKNVSRFLWLENKLHNNQLVMKFLNARK